MARAPSIFCAVLLVSASVRAQEPPPPPAAYVTPEAPPEPSSDIRYVDANSDRVGLFSTAETHPSGTLFVSDYDIAILQLGYAFTDDVQGVVTALPPVLASLSTWFLDVSMKFNVLRDEVFRLAAIGALTVVFERAGTNAWGVRAGGVAQLCFTEDCWTSVSANLQAFVNDEGEDFLPLIGSAGLLARLGEHVGLVLEPSYALIVGEGDISAVDGFLVTYGVRVSGRRWGVDLTLVKPFGEDLSAGAFDLFGVPFVSFTWRSAGDLEAP